MARYYKLFLLLLCFSTLVYPQHQNIQFTHLTTKDGLSSNRINAILKDSKGFMWFGTGDGLNLFDRETQKFTSFGVKEGFASDKILSMFEDDKGNLWLATPGCYLFGREKKCSNFLADFRLTNTILRKVNLWIQKKYLDCQNRVWLNGTILTQQYKDRKISGDGTSC